MYRAIAVPLLGLICAAPTQPPAATTEVRALLDRARALQATDPAAALRLYGEAVERARALADRAGEAQALSAQGSALLFDRPTEAQSRLQEALPLFRALMDRPGEANCLLQLGVCANVQRRYDDALARYEEALAAFQSDSVRDVAGQATALLRIGGIHRDMGRPAKGIPFLEQALPLFRSLGNTSREVATLLSLSASYGQVQKVDDGIHALERARELTRDGKNPVLQAQALHNLGALYATRDDYRGAVEAFRMALPLLEAQQRKADAAGCLNNLGLMSFRLGDLHAALAYTERAVEIYRALDNHQGAALALDTLASHHAYMGQVERGLELEKEAQAAAERSGNLRTRAHILTNLGRLYGKLGRLGDEWETVSQSLPLLREGGDRHGEAMAQHFLATNRSNAHDRARAEALERDALRGFEAINERHGIATVCLQLSVLATDRGEALRLARRALDLYQEIGYVYGEANALARIAAIQVAAGDRSAAESLYGQALLRQEALRESLKGLADAKTRYQERTFPLYRRYIRLLLDTGQNERAFAWVQRAKARTLADRMESATDRTPPPMSADERRRFDALRLRDRALTDQWLKTLERPADRSRPALGARQRQLEQDWRAFRQSRDLGDPRLAAERPAETATLASVAAGLDPDTALIEYALVESGAALAPRTELVLMVVTRRGSRARLQVFRPRGSDLATLSRQVEALRTACAGRPGTAAERPYRDAARALYRTALSPAESALAGSRRLVLCPDGPLWRAPLQALVAPGGAGAFLWERYNLVYAYSATTALRRPAPRRSAALAPLVVADPERDPSPPPGATRGLGRLVHARSEAEAIRRIFPKATLRLGLDAEEAAVKRSAGAFDSLHFATHALFNDAAPSLSGIVLARPAAGSPEDGVLTVREIQEMRLSARLVVLSACETARGADQPGEGMMGLTWAALAAGASSLVVSQWAVDDAATATLMGHFYGELGRGGAVDESLRRAALRLRRDGRHAHPYYWAPFLALGDGGPVRS